MRKKMILTALLATLVIPAATISQAAPRPFACGRLGAQPTAQQLDPQVTSVFTGMTCVWVCAETAQDALNRCIGRPSTTALPVYVTDPRDCARPTSNIATTFRNCCRPAPYNDWGVVVNGLDPAGARVRVASGCGG